MSSYDDDEDFLHPEAVAAVDDRLSLMQEFIDLEAKHKHMDREQKKLAENSHKVQARMREIRQRLGSLLGFDDPMADAKASLKREAERMRAER